MNEAQVRQQLAEFSRLVWERGWVANHDGNLSARLRRGRLMCTPTSESKRTIRADMVLVVDDGGKKLAGRGRPFSELALHLAYYHARADVGAVIHAHPPTATGLALAGVGLDQPLLPEAVVSIGPSVPTVPLTMPGGDAVQAMAPFIDEFDALLLAGNGVLTCGVDLEQAYLRMELVEHLARVALTAHQAGGARPLPANFLEPLLAARRRAGLGPEARGGNTSLPLAAKVPASSELERLVRAEIQRVSKA